MVPKGFDPASVTPDQVTAMQQVLGQLLDIEKNQAPDTLVYKDQSQLWEWYKALTVYTTTLLRNLAAERTKAGTPVTTQQIISQMSADLDAMEKRSKDAE